MSKWGQLHETVPNAGEFAVLGESWDEEGATKIEFALSSDF